MRSKLFLGLAGAALLAVIGAAWAASGTTPAADQPEAGAVAAVITPAERPPEPRRLYRAAEEEGRGARGAAAAPGR